jgi:nicotinamidase/pyrazinamidase
VLVCQASRRSGILSNTAGKLRTDGLTTRTPLAQHQALLVVDVQRDFCPGGALAAPGSDRILPAINRYVAEARDLALPIYASRDWHPGVTTHFQPYGGEWPPHCVQGSPGAEFHPDLSLPADAIVISKGEDPERPGYSAFDGHTPDGQPFLTELRNRAIDTLYVTGLTTEYCVKQTTLDGLRAGLRVSVLTDAIAGIDAHPGDVDRALAEMARGGATLTTGLAAARAR